MREAGIDPNPTIKEKLLFANCISVETEINLKSKKWTETDQTHDNGEHIEEIQNA